jgi:hypothetical protein
MNGIRCLRTTLCCRGPARRILHYRGIAQLQQGEEFLSELLAKEGFAKLREPVAAAKKTTSENQLTVHFKIDRNAVCIKGLYELVGKNLKCSVDYPPYDTNVREPKLPSEYAEQLLFPSRVQELASTAWRTFCKNDFLDFKVDATLHPDGRMSFSNYYAQVDESAVHRQSEIFKHTVRTEHGVEVEAEKSLLVFRE